MPLFDTGHTYIQAFTQNQVEYMLSDVDETGDADYKYYGYLAFNGYCVISRLTNATGAFRFFKKKNNYVASWADKANLTYVYYNELFS